MLFARPGQPARPSAAHHVSTAVSIAAHVLLVMTAAWIANLQTRDVANAVVDIAQSHRLVWIPMPGQNGGGGGGGNRANQPARRAAAPGWDRVSLPAQRARNDVASIVPDPPSPELIVATSHLAAGHQPLFGAVSADAPTVVSQGPGTGGGADTGDGTGVGDGRGSGVGPGLDRNFGGDVYNAGNGVTRPELIRDVKPAYTADAMRARVEGIVVLECVVGVDGRVGAVRILKSVDRASELDDEAIKAARQWQFRLGRKNGVAVPVFVTIELTFSMR